MKSKLMKMIWIIIFLILSNAKLFAEINYDINGYIYDLPSYQKIPDTFKNLDTGLNANSFFLNLTRIRLRPNIDFSDNTKLVVHYELDALVSKFKLPYLGNSGMTNRQAIDLNWDLTNTEISNGANLITNHYFDMFYLKQFFDWGELTFGRQVIAWGVGRVWQPTDLFNPLNPANFSKIERDGADALSSKIYLGDFTDLELVANFRKKIKDYNFGGRFRTNFAGYDFSYMSGYFDRKAVIGGDFAGNLFNAGVRGEAIYSYNNKHRDSSYIRAILGIDYQFSSKLYAMIEYQFNGAGTINTNEYLKNFTRLMKGEIQNLSQNYLAIMSNYQFHPLVTGTLTSITNLNDKSGLIGFSTVYNVLQDMNISLGTMFFYGDKNSEYNYYSTALYMTAEYFF